VASFYDEFGRRVREARERAELTQAELARRAGMSRSSLANVEAGRHRILAHQVVDLADALGMPVDQLLPSRSPLIDDKELETSSTAKVLQTISERWGSFTPPAAAD
jgi:transcriptional regulator with XRE-family HTH domain